ncbi:MAG: hypothetical protein U0K24_10960 [Lachnospiraceae bacterium]|jgi:hypothetical protein|nr:hypothetical protein [Lachnospiraceae bacterium]
MATVENKRVYHSFEINTICAAAINTSAHLKKYSFLDSLSNKNTTVHLKHFPNLVQSSAE